jgi:hypothetical protein
LLVTSGKGGLRSGSFFFGGAGSNPFPDRLLPSELAGPANGLGVLARLSLRRLLIGASLLHFPENALALHLLLQNTKRLVDVVVAD